MSSKNLGFLKKKLFSTIAITYAVNKVFTVNFCSSFQNMAKGPIQRIKRHSLTNLVEKTKNFGFFDELIFLIRLENFGRL